MLAEEGVAAADLPLEGVVHEGAVVGIAEGEEPRGESLPGFGNGGGFAFTGVFGDELDLAELAVELLDDGEEIG